MPRVTIAELKKKLESKEETIKIYQKEEAASIRVVGSLKGKLEESENLANSQKRRMGELEYLIKSIDAAVKQELVVHHGANEDLPTGYYKPDGMWVNECPPMCEEEEVRFLRHLRSIIAEETQ